MGKTFKALLIKLSKEDKAWNAWVGASSSPGLLWSERIVVGDEDPGGGRRVPPQSPAPSKVRHRRGGERLRKRGRKKASPSVARRKVRRIDERARIAALLRASESAAKQVPASTSRFQRRRVKVVGVTSRDVTFPVASVSSGPGPVLTPEPSLVYPRLMVGWECAWSVSPSVCSVHNRELRRNVETDDIEVWCRMHGRAYHHLDVRSRR